METLSDKIFKDYNGNDGKTKIHIKTDRFLIVKDVKEFIRKLKFIMRLSDDHKFIYRQIDKLAGDKLT